MGEIDPSFIQSLEHRPKLLKVEAQGIPKIDLAHTNSPNYDANSPEIIHLAKDIGDACKNWGFFMIVNHSVPVEKYKKLQIAAREFFALPGDEKNKSEHANHMKKIYELEMELKKLSGQQNLQQRIHHHAKIKEENNLLQSQNEELSSKLRRLEYKFSHAKEEFDRYYLAKGRKNLDINFDEEHRLNCLLKEAKEEEKVQLAQKLVGLCTSILKAAGTRPASDVSISAAEEALDQIKNRFTSLERELQDVKFKNRISAEKIRLSEMQQSPVSPRADGNQLIRGLQSPFLSSLDR